MDKKFKALLPPSRWSSPRYSRARYARHALVQGAAGVSWGYGRSDGHRSATRLRGETRVRHARCLQAPRHSVGLVERIDLLASTGRRDGGWVYSEFQMAKDLVDYLTLRDDGDEPQHSALAKGTRGHIQVKHPLEQPRPAPARRCGVRLLVHPLLPERREDRPTHMAVRRQTAAIAHQMNLW